MEKVMNIKGMMCGHCEARVKKSLEELPGVDEAIVSHKEGTAVVKMSIEIPELMLNSAVEELGFKVL